MIGKNIGVYEGVSQIGEGGMGKVFRGLDSLVNREVAIKTPHPALLADEGLVERFRADAVTMAKLHHPKNGSWTCAERRKSLTELIISTAAHFTILVTTTFVATAC